MAEKKPTRAAARKSSGTFTDEERAAVREAIREHRAAAKGGKQDGEGDVRAKIAGMEPHDRAIAERIHSLVRSNAPTLVPRTWYGMPAYSKDDEVLCWFQPAQKFKTRYGMLGFSDESKLDEGHIWPVAYAVKELNAAEETRIVALLKKAVG